MRKVFKFILPLALVVISIVVVIGLAGYAASQRPERKSDGEQAVLVETIEAVSTSLNFTVTSQGAVRPRTETTLVSEVSGKVVSVSPDFIAGGFFRKGDVLLQIDPSDYETALKRAEAALASRRAALADASARSEQALKDWRNLGRQGEPSDLVLRKPQLADAQANVQAAEADVDKARRDLQRTRITVPYDGLVRVKRVDVGQYVTPGTQLGVTFSVDTAEIRLPLSAADLQFLELPSSTDTDASHYPPVSLHAEEAGISRRWEAQIIRTEGVLDDTSRVLYAVAQVTDPYGVLGQSTQPELRMGTFVRAEIQGRYLENAVVLPRYVLNADQTVLVANDERRLEIRQVTVARAEPREVYLTAGIEGGEQVITTTLEAPIPGMRLTVRGEADGASGSAPEPEIAAAAGDTP